MTTNERDRQQMIFLLGPPGSGKTTLGARVCTDLGLAFLDLSAPSEVDRDPVAARKQLEAGIGSHSDVVAVSWDLQQHNDVLAMARQVGELLLLWAHPEEMQVRSARAEPLFTPVGRLKTRGGFGRNGTGCREFRRLDRQCSETFLLVGVPFEEAAEALREYVVDLREEHALPPAEREGLQRWIKKWQIDHDAHPRASAILVDAMARYTLHLKSQGVSPRTLSGVYSDLDAAGMLVMMYEAPKNEEVLRHFYCPPWVFEFRRKFTDSPSLVARYEKNLQGFSCFLKREELLPSDEDEETDE